MSSSVGSATSRRFVATMAMLVALLAASSANAATITILNTWASAQCLTQVSQGPLNASCSAANPGGTLTAAALADVKGGHLGAAASSTIPGYASMAQSGFNMYMTVQGGEPGDVLQFDLKLDGSFSFGGGGTVQLIYDTVSGQNETIDSAIISCNTYNLINRGTDCWQSPVSTGAGAAGNTTRFFVSLSGLDSIALTGSLIVSTGPNATPGAGVSADFLNSALLTVTVPKGTTIVNNPGGVLFQEAGSTTAPEPASALLLGAGVLGLVLRRKHTL